MIKNGSLFAFLILLIIITACTQSPKTVEVKKLYKPNPTSYIFDLPANKLRDTVIKLFELDPQYNDPILGSIFVDRILKDHPFAFEFSIETLENAVFGREYFKTPETDKDIFIWDGGNAWYSPVYHHKDKPFLFSSSFAFKFKSVSDQKTLLTVVDFDPQISNGTKCCSPHGNYSIMQKVQPTTVEEYTLILYIAKKLNVKGLPAIQLPR